MNGVPALGTEPLAGQFPAPPTAVRWHVLAILVAFSFMSWFNRVSMSVAGDEAIMKGYDISPTRMGIVYSAFLFAYALFMTPGGWFSDRYGSWQALAVMGLGSAVFGMLTGVVGWLTATASGVWIGLILARTTMGLFTAPIYPATSKVIAYWLPFRQRAWANGLIMGAALVGIASTFFGFGALISWFGWQTAFVITGTVTGLLALVWMAYARERPDQHPGVNAAELQHIQAGSLWAAPEAEPGRRQAAGWRSLLRNRSLVLLTISYAAVGYFEYLFYFWMHFYFEVTLKLGEEKSRLYATVVNLAMAFGMILGGLVADRLIRHFGYRVGRTVVPVAGMLASAAFLVLGLLADEPGWIAVWFALALASVGACEGPLWATAIDMGGRQGGTAAGIFNTGGNAGGILAPVVTPWVSTVFGWWVGIGLGSLVCLVGAGLWFWIDPEERCSEPEA